MMDAGSPHDSDRRVDAICDRFEAAWRRGERPRIEDELDQAPEADRPALFDELLGLELEFRRKAGEQPGSSEYVARFPDRVQAVRAGFGEASSPTAPTSRDPIGRELLIGVLALQNDFITREDLVGAFGQWMAAKSRPFSQVLRERGNLDAGRLALIEALAAEHLKTHGGDPNASLAALGSFPTARRALGRVADDQLQASLVEAAAGRTLVEGPGAPTVTGPTTADARRFEIVRFHARGGLGEVYVARDGELNREVALKRIQARFANDEACRARFLLEAEVTGGLEHPGIVPVYGLGADEAGQPYYAMRFIQGDSLKDAADAFHATDRTSNRDPGERALAFRRLLQRFIDVCEAVAYAHSRGVLHRDLKPGNVMLGRYGETLLVDWGLAKPLGRREALNISEEATLRPSSNMGGTPTQQGSALGTPAYMSPEQAAGRLEELGPASDVYGLGATLFYVLTGRAPVSAPTVEEVLRKVERGQISSPRSYAKDLAPPLEAVCLKAMAREPGDRYGSPEALAEDIEHWLADEPVSAMREPFTERARRWMRRHRTGVTAGAAALLVALVGMATVLGVQSRANSRLARANDELAEANREVQARFDLAMSAIKTFHTGVSEDFLLKQASFRELRKKLLSEARDFYKKLEMGLEGRTDEASRGALASAFLQLGDLTEKIGSPEEALTSVTKAAAIREDLVQKHPEGPPGLVSDLVVSLHDKARLQAETGNPADALRSCERVIELARGLTERFPDVAEYRRELAAGHHELGLIMRAAGRPVEALREMEQARDVRDRGDDKNSDDEVVLNHRAAIYGDIGTCLRDLRRLDESLAAHERAIEINRKLLAAHPTADRSRRDLAAGLTNIGILHWMAGHEEAASTAYAEARDHYQSLVSANPSVLVFQAELANINNNIGNIARESGRLEESKEHCERARTALQRLVDEGHGTPDVHSMLAASLNNLAATLALEDDAKGAHELLLEAIKHQRTALSASPGHPTYRHFLSNQLAGLADARLELGLIDDAVAALRELGTMGLKDPNRLYDIACGLARCAARTQGTDEAKERADESFATLKRAVETGFSDGEHMADDKDLLVLRDRDDFQTLVKSLREKGGPAKAPASRD